VPRQDKIAADSTVEMTWHTFAGEYENVYLALLKQRCIDDAIEPTEENVAELFKLHLHRGIGYLAGDPTLKSIEALVSKSTV
jgi:DNA sulfur modification protein DndE